MIFCRLSVKLQICSPLKSNYSLFSPVFSSFFFSLFSSSISSPSPLHHWYMQSAEIRNKVSFEVGVSYSIAEKKHHQLTKRTLKSNQFYFINAAFLSLHFLRPPALHSCILSVFPHLWSRDTIAHRKGRGPETFHPWIRSGCCHTEKHETWRQNECFFFSRHFIKAF